METALSTRLLYQDWKPSGFGDAIVGHVLYFENPEEGAQTSFIRSHGIFYRMPVEVSFQIHVMKPVDGSLLVVEYQPEGYRVAVLCEYRQAAKKLRRFDQNVSREKNRSLKTSAAKQQGKG